MQNDKSIIHYCLIFFTQYLFNICSSSCYCWSKNTM